MNEIFNRSSDLQTTDEQQKGPLNFFLFAKIDDS